MPKKKSATKGSSGKKAAAVEVEKPKDPTPRMSPATLVKKVGEKARWVLNSTERLQTPNALLYGYTPNPPGPIWLHGQRAKLLYSPDNGYPTADAVGKFVWWMSEHGVVRAPADCEAAILEWSKFYLTSNPDRSTIEVVNREAA